MRRLFILLLFLIFGLLLLFAFSPSLYADDLEQATKTPMPVMAIPFNETITGKLAGIGEESSLYTFDMPLNQDVVIAYRADKVVLHRYCVRTAASTATSEDCESQGGGGGDGMVSIIFMIPGLPDTQQTVEFSLYRPLQGSVSYQFTVYTITPQRLTPGQSAHSATAPYDVYTVDLDPTQPFTVQIEDEAPEGDFLWAAYQPYLPYVADVVTMEEHDPFPQYIDRAWRTDNPKGVTLLELYHLGGNRFRILVDSAGAYRLFFTLFQAQPLDEKQEHLVTVSNREPVQAIRLGTAQGDMATIQVEVLEGPGAQISVYTEGGELTGNVLTLGPSPVTDAIFSLSGTIEHAVSVDSDVMVVVHLPFEATRGTVTVKLTWHR